MLRDKNYKQLDHINYIRWFLSQRSENIPTDGVIMKGSTAICKGINNDMWYLLQQLESLHVLDVPKARKQSSI